MRQTHSTTPANEVDDQADGVPEMIEAELVDAGLDDAESGAATETPDRISELERELTSERDRNLRLVAEFDNFRKRMMKERLEAESRGQMELVKQIIDPLDDIARFAHVDPAITDSNTLVQGVDMVEKKLGKSLRQAGLEPVNPVGERFDPSLHEAVGTDIAETPEEDHTVSRVYQAGYTFKGQLLRPARVVVKQYPGSR